MSTAKNPESNDPSDNSAAGTTTLKGQFVSNGLSESRAKLSKSKRRSFRVRSRITANVARPRLSVNISNLHVSAQIIDDTTGKTLAYSTSVGQKLTANLSERAKWVGADVAKKAKAAKIKQVVYDRGRRLYHGRIKHLAQAARAGGLEF